MGRITVSVNDSHLESISGVADRLRKEGMEVENELASLGVITGTINDSKLSALGSVEGVKSVSKDQAFRIPSSDADVQ